MTSEEIITIINQLYCDVDGYEISAQARKKLLISDKALTYGEVNPRTFGEILTQVNPHPGEIFYDLGSGTGKAVMLAHLNFNFSKSIGVELLEDIYLAAKKVLKKYDQEIKPKLDSQKQNENIEYINGDFFRTDLSDADVVFCHSTCLNEEAMVVLEDKLSNLKKGTRIITVTKNLHLPIFCLLKTQIYNMGWGRATVFFYMK